MKYLLKYLYFILLFLIYITSLYSVEENIISGRIFRKYEDSHENIKLILIQKNNRIEISETETVLYGDFYFENIKSGEYILKIINGNEIKEVDILKKDKKYIIEDIILEIKDKDLFFMYTFSKLIMLAAFGFNIFVIFIIKNRKQENREHKLKIKGSKYIIYSLYSINLWFAGEIIRFFIGFIDEYQASILWPVSHLGTIYMSLFLFIFFTIFPVFRLKNKLYKIFIAVNFFLSNLFSIILMTWIFFRNDKEFYAFYKVKTTHIFSMYQFLILITFGIIIFILIKNYFEEKDTINANISISIVKSLCTTIFFVFFIFYSTFLQKEQPFRGYYNIIIAGADIFFYWNILKYVLNFFYDKNYTKIQNFFVEVVKYIIIFSGIFIFFGFFYIENKLKYLIFGIIIFFIKYLLDIYFSYRKNKNRINFEHIPKRIIALENMEIIEKILEKELKEILDIEKLKIIVRDEFDEELERVFKYILSGNNKKLEINFINYKFIEEFDTILKIKNENIISALIFVKFNEKKVLNSRIIYFLNELTQSISYPINNCILYEKKKKIQKKELIEKEAYEKKIFYSKKFAELIKNKTENNEIIELCNMILK